MIEDLRYAFRTLGKRLGFTAVAVLTLAVAIGANTAIFSVVKGVLLNPLPFEDPERLVGVWHKAPGLGFTELNASPSTYLTYREESRVFEESGLWRGNAATVTGKGEPERVETLTMTAGVLPLLRVNPDRGRLFREEDDRHNAAPTVLLTYAYWQAKFGGDPGVIGQPIVVDGKQHEVIGILRKDFRFLNENPSLILPLQLNRAEVMVGQFSYLGVGRLKPGVTLAQANADVERMLLLVPKKFPFPPGLSAEMLSSARIEANIRPFKYDAVGDIGEVLWILLGTAGVVLLIACANVANLLLVRGEGRQQELAIRSALGADRMQIGRQLLLESLLLGLGGGLAGLALGWVGVRTLVQLRPGQIPRLDEITIDPAVLAYTLGIALLSGLLFGLIPLMKFTRPQVSLSLRDGGRTASTGKERHRARNLLVVTQVAMALVLMIGSGLMLRTFRSLRDVQPGFTNAKEVLTLRISIPSAQVSDSMAVVRMQEQMLRGIEAIPGVTSVAFASSLPMSGSTNNDPVFVQEFPEPGGKLAPIRRFRFVSPGYFKTMGNAMLAGRDSTWAEVMEHRNIAVVSESFARLYWKSPAAALGKRIRESPQSPWREIIGVASDELDDGAHKPAPVLIYWPVAIDHFWEPGIQVQRSAAFVVRSARTGTPALLKEVQQAVWAVNPGVPTASVRSMAEVQDRSMMRTSFTLLMVLLAGVIALILGVVGIYGVISYAVSQRTREIGIRMALGAQRSDVSGLFVRQGLVLVSVGTAVGLAAATVCTRLMASQLFGVKPVDALTYMLVSLGLAATALMACYLPARRAAALDPVRALHSD